MRKREGEKQIEENTLRDIGRLEDAKRERL
jgi:hypothetical protein